jgi:hypothetical protein
MGGGWTGIGGEGGNGDNAHACQQGGHENRFEAETGNPFKSPDRAYGPEAPGPGSTPPPVSHSCSERRMRPEA